MEMIQEITTPSVTTKSNAIRKSNYEGLLLTKSGSVSMICKEVNSKYNSSYHNSDNNKKKLLGRALHDFDDGEKALDLLAPPGDSRYSFCKFIVLCIFCIFFNFFARAAAVYGFCYYFKIHHDRDRSMNWCSVHRRVYLSSGTARLSVSSLDGTLLRPLLTPQYAEYAVIIFCIFCIL
jgi:hypothetical protein